MLQPWGQRSCPHAFTKKSKIILNPRKINFFDHCSKPPVLKLAKNANFSIGYCPGRYVLRTY